MQNQTGFQIGKMYLDTFKRVIKITHRSDNDTNFYDVICHDPSTLPFKVNWFDDDTPYARGLVELTEENKALFL